METNGQDSLKQLDELLAVGNQSWLFGAGISLEAGIPLMGPLTDRVFSIAKEKGEEKDDVVLKYLKKQLAEDAHIEHILSQLGDYRAIVERSREKQESFDGVTMKLGDLDALHGRILGWIAEIVRWGYRPSSNGVPEKIGSREELIVKVDDHSAFVSALFHRNQAGRAERRRAVRLFTTNYDTLLEDALALGSFPYWDGFTGGAVAFRSHQYGDDEPDIPYRAHIVKLHGSIDWRLGEDGRVWRVRDGDLYPGTTSRVLIYPQSTKYLASQRDPLQLNSTYSVAHWHRARRTFLRPVVTASAMST